jgi:hypothetical protein
MRQALDAKGIGLPCRLPLRIFADWPELAGLAAAGVD